MGLTLILLLDIGTAQQLSTAELYQTASKAVVLIVTQKGGSAQSTGTGVIVSSDGFVVTALHVVEGGDSVAIKLKTGELFDEVKVAAVDARRDIAILKIPGFDLSTVPLGNSSNVKEGEAVAVISNPKGLEHTIATGVISAIRTLDDQGIRVMQFSAPASPGSSGGAVLNASGELIGIVSFKKIGGESLNFAIPINYVRGLLSQPDYITLSQLNSKLRSSSVRPVSALLTTQYGDASGRWKNLADGREYHARLEGDRIYVERLGQSSAADGSFLCDLQKSQDLYKGACRYSYTVEWWNQWWARNEARRCSFTFGMEITSLSPTRIEGRGQSLGSGDKWTDKDARECGKRFKLEWNEFTLIRPSS